MPDDKQASQVTCSADPRRHHRGAGVFRGIWAAGVKKGRSDRISLSEEGEPGQAREGLRPRGARRAAGPGIPHRRYLLRRPMPDQLIRDHDIPARARVTSGLRQAADYLDQHPGIPVSEHGWTLLSFPPRDDDDADRAEVDRVAAILGVTPADDTADGGHYRAVLAFGPVTYEFVHIPARQQAAHRALMSYAGAITPASLPGAA